MKTISLAPLFGAKGQHVEQLQIRLNELGFLTGNLDGAFGKQTKLALAHFQSSQGISETGDPDPTTLKLLGLTAATGLDSDPLMAVPALVDRAGISVIRWQHGNRGQAPYGYYYGMAVMFANMYDRLTKGEDVIEKIAGPLMGNPDRDALERWKEPINEVTSNPMRSDAERLRGMFVLMFGLGLMESSGRHCCGWDRGKLNGWGKPSKAKVPSANNSEAGLFQTSYDIISSVPTDVKAHLLAIMRRYQLSGEGHLPLFSKGCIPKAGDAENIGEGEGLVFQALFKECPGFSVEFTALALRYAAKHWNPVIHVGESEHGLEIRKECDELLRSVQEYIDKPGIRPDYLVPMSDAAGPETEMREAALTEAGNIGQRSQLQKLFDFAPSSKANYWAVVDYNKPSDEKRLFIFSLREGLVRSYFVSHGQNSGERYATRFSNNEGSHQSSLGIFKTGTTDIGSHGRSLLLKGMEASNSNAKKRYIVIHQAPYVTDRGAGRSHGCFVVSPGAAPEVINALQNGSFLLAWHACQQREAGHAF